MIRIAYTTEEPSAHEDAFITSVIDCGWDYVHLRHPSLDADDYRRILDSLSPCYLPKVRIHGYFSLADEYGLGGIHLNSRFPDAPTEYRGTVSRSLHSPDELTADPDSDEREAYVTLSPIFPSISKEGYAPTFDRPALQAALASCRRNVIALGGITPQNFPLLSPLGFAGFAVLGYLSQYDNQAELMRRLRQFG